MNRDRLGAIDATYLAIESAVEPLHVASVGIFSADGLCDAAGVPRLEEIRARMATRLHLLPRLRQRPASVPFDAARPVWVDDEQFDIANHVDAVGLNAPYDEAELLDLVAELIMEPLDRSQPLWHMRLVTGLEGNRVALIERAHHAMVDGVSGVDVSLVLLDTEPDAPAPTIPEPWVPRHAPGLAQLLAEGLRDRIEAPLKALAGATSALRHPGDVAKVVADAGAAITALQHDGVRAPHSSLNGPLGKHRVVRFVRQRFADVHAAGEAAGATVNDVVLAAVTSALRDLFLARGEQLPAGRIVKVLIPVSVRAEDESMALGNRVGGLVASLPIGIGDPAERLAMITAQTRDLKASPEAAVADRLLQVADLLPESVTHLVQRGIDSQPLVNMVVTNVPGPPFPLYALGSRMLEAFPIVPLGARMTLEVAILSYDGALNIGVTADRDACPDVDVFVHGLESAFAELGVTWAPVAG